MQLVTSCRTLNEHLAVEVALWKASQTEHWKTFESMTNCDKLKSLKLVVIINRTELKTELSDFTSPLEINEHRHNACWPVRNKNFFSVMQLINLAIVSCFLDAIQAPVRWKARNRKDYLTRIGSDRTSSQPFRVIGFHSTCEFLFSSPPKRVEILFNFAQQREMLQSNYLFKQTSKTNSREVRFAGVGVDSISGTFGGEYL